MKYIDFNEPCRVHFIGIGGISMSGFAELLSKKGFKVSGSDSKESAITERLSELGIEVRYGQSEKNITDDLNVVIYTAAVKQDNPELLKARALGIPCIERAQLVGDCMLHFRHNYAVAGTHGKTTTTSMLSLVLLNAGIDPTVSVGGILPEIGGNMRIGSSDSMVVEACEYTDSFLKFHPTHAIITNIEAEHLDYFKDLETERKSFRTFAALLPSDGLLVVNNSIPSYSELFAGIDSPIVTYSLKDASAAYYASDISYDELGHGRFTLMHGKNPVGQISLNVVGEHNVSNAVAICAMGLSTGLDFEKIAEGLSLFHGTNRRFEKKGEIQGVTIIDDYAHHPTEIAATLKAAEKYPHNKLWVVFQPHTYSRTASLLNETAEALSLADSIVLTDIYAAREVNTYGVTSLDIVNILKTKYGKNVYHFSSFDEIETFLLQNCCARDMLITMGAGDVVKIGESLLGR